MKSVNKKFIRIMAIILAALTVLGTLTAAIAGFIMSAGALEEDDGIVIADTLATEEAEDTVSSASSLSGKIVRVGLFFRNSSYDQLRMNHSISSATGLRFYMTDENGSEICSFASSVKSVSIIREDNVAKNSDGVYEAAEQEDADIFTYALRMKDSFSREYPLKQELTYATQKNGYDPIYPIFENGSMYLCIGNFPTSDAALKRFTQIKQIYDRDFSLKSSNDFYITVIDNETGKIVLRADTSKYALKVEPNYKSTASAEQSEEDVFEYALSLSIGAVDIVVDPIEVEYDSIPYITTAIGNTYAGTFEYKATADGLTLTNILTLDDYVKSVIPYEIYNDWPKEAIKAFAIVSRTYALTNFHSGADFDICSETHCQAYLGRGRSTDYTDACVDEVANLILTYNGKPAETFYHAVSGGVTESAANVWGSDPAKYPYLASVITPEEKYSSHTNGIWSSSVTMSELSDYILSKKSYAAKFTADITDITILETTDAGYVRKLLLTDADGNQVTVSTADSVRILLSRFVKSANFIISRGIPIIKANSTLDTISHNEAYPILTAGGQDSISYSDTLYAISSSGTSAIEADGSMQFIGKGYGHGVGLSQCGAHDMAELGYSFDKILSIYYPGTVLTKYI